MIKDSTGVILAGGENTRMPVLKSFIEVRGQKIIERNIKITRQLFKEVFIVTNQPEYYSYLGATLFGDVYNTRGPMTGIFTALLNSSSNWVFISACDMPFINMELIAYMALKRDNVDIVAPVTNDKPEPLFAFYSRRLLGAMEEAVLAGRKSLRGFLANYRVKYITTREIETMDPGALSFVNLNEPADVDVFLKDRDRMDYKRKVERRGICSV